MSCIPTVLFIIGIYLINFIILKLVIIIDNDDNPPIDFLGFMLLLSPVSIVLSLIVLILITILNPPIACVRLTKWIFGIKEQ